MWTQIGWRFVICYQEHIKQLDCSTVLQNYVLFRKVLVLSHGCSFIGLTGVVDSMSFVYVFKFSSISSFVCCMLYCLQVKLLVRYKVNQWKWIFFIMLLKNYDLIDCWMSAPKSKEVSVLYAFIEQKVGTFSIEKKELLHKIQRFHCKMNKYWNECKRNKIYFEQKYFNWLNETFLDLDHVSWHERLKLSSYIKFILIQ